MDQAFHASGRETRKTPKVREDEAARGEHTDLAAAGKVN
jgi:hypothetical protein